MSSLSLQDLELKFRPVLDTNRNEDTAGSVTLILRSHRFLAPFLPTMLRVQICPFFRSLNSMLKVSSSAGPRSTIQACTIVMIAVCDQDFSEGDIVQSGCLERSHVRLAGHDVLPIFQFGDCIPERVAYGQQRQPVSVEILRKSCCTSSPPTSAAHKAVESYAKVSPGC
jgi:hypothetical protein